MKLKPKTKILTCSQKSLSNHTCQTTATQQNLIHIFHTYFSSGNTITASSIIVVLPFQNFELLLFFLKIQHYFI